MTRTIAEKPTVSFLTTPPTPCPYLEGRMERKVVTSLGGMTSSRFFQALSLAGFRRSHHLAYVPACPDCDACVSVRIVVDQFSRKRSLARTWRKNAGLTAVEQPPVATDEQYALFMKYLRFRHPGGDMADMSESDYVFMVEDTPVDSKLVEFRDAKGALVAACLADRLPDGYSAVYSFFDPDLDPQGLGNFMVLWLIERSRQAKLPYVYLGYWIDGCRKMSYKQRFAPLEGLKDGEWVPMADILNDPNMKNAD
ncbi:MAG: arginyltransferase [Magnetospiraceae bacterium]